MYDFFDLLEGKFKVYIHRIVSVSFYIIILKHAWIYVECGSLVHGVLYLCACIHLSLANHMAAMHP